jgi:prolyl-tRNA synthetase
MLRSSILFRYISGMARALASRSDVEASLSNLEIPFRTVEHEEVFTIEEMLAKVQGVDGAILKNLFLKDKKGRFILLSALHSTTFSISQVMKKIGGCGGGLRGAPEESLEQVLGVQRGAVTPFALANDAENKVIWVLDAAVQKHQKVCAHPMVNSATTEISTEDLLKFCRSVGKEPLLLSLDEEAPAKPATTTPKAEGVEAEGAKKKETKLGISVSKAEDFSGWYTEVITKGEMIDYYDVSGCYIIRPWAYSIWESIQAMIDSEIKALGVKNAYFPMFVSQRALMTEKEHVEGFAPEVAWVTRSGDSELNEPIAVRPTSETIMYPAFSKWVRSHRDLPLKLNQWCNVVRWEFKHPTPFLRTREFLWQEGHTVYATLEEAMTEVHQILDIYARVYQELLAIPVVKGQKSENERFPGGLVTTTVETMIPGTGRAIQGATSHCLGQNFSKMFDILFEDEEGVRKHAWQNSWGLTTRTIGVMIMFHGDDRGLVLPPRVAPLQVIIVPITDKGNHAQIIQRVAEMREKLKSLGVRVDSDERPNYTAGWKYNNWEQKGVPIRIEIGPRDLKNNTFRVVRRDNQDKKDYNISELDLIPHILDDIQSSLFERARQELESRKVQALTWPEFMSALNAKNIVLTPWCQDTQCEVDVKEKSAAESKIQESKENYTGAAKTLCMPFEQGELEENAVCFHCGKKATKWTLWGRSY